MEISDEVISLGINEDKINSIYKKTKLYKSYNMIIDSVSLIRIEKNRDILLRLMLCTSNNRIIRRRSTLQISFKEERNIKINKLLT